MHSNILNLHLNFDTDSLVLTTLEKVQGDEFDVMYISLGYAKDAAGTFGLRFGPLNQDGGEKRLNVLFSRARRALHLFHSVRAADFGHSENLGVQGLKNYLLMHEESYALKNEESVVNTKIDSELSNNMLEICDPFYDKDAVANLMNLKRHADWSGLKLKIRFLKD
jgi:superfamily I DNA and/or RNA helicase